MSLEIVECDIPTFKSALSAYASSVNVITMWDERRQALGMTATAFSSVSIDPLLVLVCINTSTRTYRHIARDGSFGVNVLSSCAQDVSDHCATPGMDKSLPLAWLAKRPGWSTPALSGALAFLDCWVDQEVQAGTHTVLIGSVRAIGLNPGAADDEPLLHFRGAYRQLASIPAGRVPRPLPIILQEETA